MEAKLKLDKLLSYFGTNKNKLGQATGKRQTFYDISKGQIKSFSAEVVAAIKKVHPEINERWFLYDEGEMIEVPDKKTDAMNQLGKIQNGKNKYNEGRIVPDAEIIKIKSYIIPIKGFAGLKNALYDDMYINENFEQTQTEVPKELYASVSYKIQSTGDSMPTTIPEKSWVTGVPIPEQDWMDYKFKPNKVYVLFHPFRGILFKYVKTMPHNEVQLSSQNSEEHPEEIFKITEFRKILIAIKVETFI